MYNIFRAHNKRDEHQLEKLFSSIEENPLILWQLNTNADFRGIMVFSQKIKTIYNLDIDPDFYLCSSSATPYTLNNKPFLDVSYDNGKTEIIITNQFEIMEHYELIDDFLSDGSFPRCGGACITLMDGGSGRPVSLKETAYILKVKIKPEQKEPLTKDILYMGYVERSVIVKFLMAKRDDFSRPEEIRSGRYFMDFLPRTYSDPLDKKLSILKEKLS